MSTKIRLTRGGRKKVPYYTVVVTDSRSSRDGKFIEKLGKYNPLLSKDDANRFVIDDKERAEYWLSTGAQPSERVAILMIKAGIKGAEKYKPVFVPKKKKVEEQPTEEGKTENSESTEGSQENNTESTTEA